jgi:hypothetical protein
VQARGNEDKGIKGQVIKGTLRLRENDSGPVAECFSKKKMIWGKCFIFEKCIEATGLRTHI